ncbi:MAG: Uxx-star family glutaredoxin-like (seleno)protein [Bryobacteraceae bacterium]
MRADSRHTSKYELYGAARCPYTAEMRDWLELRNLDFVEYDVEADPAALERMKAIAGGQRAVPVLVQDGRVVQTGWQGRSCVVG